MYVYTLVNVRVILVVAYVSMCGVCMCVWWIVRGYVVDVHTLQDQEAKAAAEAKAKQVCVCVCVCVLSINRSCKLVGGSEVLMPCQ